MKTDRLPDLSLMMPIFNEEDCLEEVTKELVQELKKADINFELVLVNNGSWDGSQQIIDALEKEYPEHIKSVKFKKNQKLGGAVNKVTCKLRAKIIGFTCADGEVSAQDCAKIARIIINNNDISLIKTVRLNRLDGYRIYISKIYNWMVKLFYRIKTRDVSGWPVLIRYEDFRRMHLRNYTWIFQLEYLYQLKKMGKKMKEIDVLHQHRRGGKSKVNLEIILIFLYQTVEYRIRTLFRR